VPALSGASAAESTRSQPERCRTPAARANPAWTMIEIPGVGHVPQLEAPGDTASAITGWLGNAAQPAAQAASPVPGPPMTSA
jgi:pimeloyl-ACP methyl ester carboxylesterase